MITQSPAGGTTVVWAFEFVTIADIRGVQVNGMLDAQTRPLPQQYSVNGERRSFALLRPIADVAAQNRIRELVLEAFAEYEEKAALQK